MSEGGPDPSELAAEASGATEAATEAATGAAGEGASKAADAYPSGGGDEGGSNPLKALFETDPDMDPEKIQGPAWVGEAVVGVRKFVHGLGIDTGDATDGDPAIANFGRAFKSYADENGIDLPLVGGRDRADDDDADDGPGVTVRDA